MAGRILFLFVTIIFFLLVIVAFNLLVVIAFVLLAAINFTLLAVIIFIPLIVKFGQKEEIANKKWALERCGRQTGWLEDRRSPDSARWTS